MARGRAVVCLLAVLAGAAHPARAGEPDPIAASHEAYVAGTHLYDLGEYRHALDAFKRGYLLYASPAFVYNIARCHERLGERTAAIERYQAFLDLTEDEGERQKVRERLVVLRREVEEERAAAARRAEVRPTPVYKKWWLWTTVGVVAAGLGVGLGLGLGLRPTPPSSHLGTVGAF